MCRGSLCRDQKNLWIRSEPSFSRGWGGQPENSRLRHQGFSFSAGFPGTEHLWITMACGRLFGHGQGTLEARAPGMLLPVLSDFSMLPGEWRFRVSFRGRRKGACGFPRRPFLRCVIGCELLRAGIGMVGCTKWLPSTGRPLALRCSGLGWVQVQPVHLRREGSSGGWLPCAAPLHTE